MLYKFHSKAGADVIMTGPHGDALLKRLGREPAPQGIFTVEQIPAAIAAIEAAIAADEAPPAESGDAAAPRQREGVSLRQRAWPLAELLKRALASGHPVTWGA